MSWPYATSYYPQQSYGGGYSYDPSAYGYNNAYYGNQGYNYGWPQQQQPTMPQMPNYQPPAPQIAEPPPPSNVSDMFSPQSMMSEPPPQADPPKRKSFFGRLLSFGLRWVLPLAAAFGIGRLSKGDGGPATIPDGYVKTDPSLLVAKNGAGGAKESVYLVKDPNSNKMKAAFQVVNGQPVLVDPSQLVKFADTVPDPDYAAATGDLLKADPPPASP